MIYNRDYNYEISIWTLQDSFITVLKNSNLELEGWLLDGSIEINVDGTLNLSFSIPMYIYQDGILQENPIWYNTTNGNLIANMRKIKVIINKNNTEEKVYEFLITKVIERHETDLLYCDVEGEGLAFHELGKIGYKISLSSEELFNSDSDVFNLQYWLKEASIDKYREDLDSSTWGYEIKIEQLNGEDSDKIYEDDYLTWKVISENEPLEGEGYSNIEKSRPVDIEESNIYNITLKLAEIFGVFCRYEYEYDDNFHIQHRKIIFYNNFLLEKEGYIDLTYPYSTNSIKRNIDSTDLITKMYVRPVNAGVNSDIVTIMNTPANKGLEDYILNFDYLYSIGTITKEQYDAVEAYRENLHKLNNRIDDLSTKINAIEAQLPELKATITTLTNSIQLDGNNIDLANNLKKSLTGGAEAIKITEDNPEVAVLLNEEDLENRYYIKLKQTGIIPGSIHIYKKWTTPEDGNSKILSDEIINSGLLEYDEFGGITEIHNLLWESDDLNAPKIVYLKYNYNPSEYYGKVLEYWAKKLKQDQDNLDAANDKLNKYNEKLEKQTESGDKIGYKIDLAKKIDEKNEYIKNFNKLMGPAIREGYWQPEDYNDYGETCHDVYEEIKNNNNNNNNNNNIVEVLGDSGKSVFEWSFSFDDEELTSYKIGIEEGSKNYLAVDLSNIENKTKLNITNLNFIFHTADGNKNLRCFPIGSECQLCYLYTNNKKLKPILLLTGAKNLTDSECQALEAGRIYIANLRFNENTKINEYDTTTGQEIIDKLLYLLTLNLNDKICYPRIRIDDLNLKLDSDLLLIKYNGTILELYKDYYITFKTNGENTDFPYSYYITIRPEVLIKDISNKSELDIKFTFSTAADHIYLDAVQILKENAYPKVSYEISPSVINDKYLGKTYTMLNRIVNINDVKLKFENVLGYVSKVNLVLDKPWEDKIEIKNYKNKFEDLFSTIVALTEEMKKNENLISSLGGIFSNGGLNSEALEKTIYNNKTILLAYLDAGFDDSSVIEDKLTEVFNAAGEILNGASSSTSAISALNTKNAKILSGFAVNVLENLTPNITYGDTPPDDFKEGDIWIQQDGEENEIARYVCTTSKSNLKNYDPDKDSNSNFYDGWTKTSDGRLALISGASINVDAAAGTMELLAKNQITLGSAGDVDIIGGKVNIGGTLINIGSASEGGTPGGINLVATLYNTENFTNPGSSISKVLINPSKIEMASADIEMAAGNGITMYASDDKRQTALKINKDEGIWMGSTLGINFFSGGSMNNWNKETTYSENEIICYEEKYYKSLKNDNKNQKPTNSNSSYWEEITSDDVEAGASMSINSDKILFGVANSNQGTAAEMTKEYIILGASISDYNTLTEKLFTIGTKNDIEASGVKITLNSIGFSTGLNDNRSTFLMDQTGLILAAGNTTDIDTTTHTGSYVLIKPDGIDLGANGNLYINTSNILLLTKLNDPIENNDSSFGTLFALGTNLNNDPEDSDPKKRPLPKLVFDAAGNLTITGNINAESLTIANSGGTNKDLVQYIENLNKRIDDEIQTWFGKGKPLYNGTSTTTGALEHNIVVDTNGKEIQIYDASQDQSDNDGYYKEGDIVFNESVGYYYKRRATQKVNPPSGSNGFWDLILIDFTGKNDRYAYWFSNDNDKHIGDIYYDIAESLELAKGKIWDKNQTYSKNQIVRYNSKYYKSKTDSNTNHIPSVNNSSFWDEIEESSIPYSETAGQAFRFIQDGNNGYKWLPIEDTITVSTAERMERIRNGEVGLAFANTGGNSFVTLNNTDGLVIMGKKQTEGTYKDYYPFFRATNNAMGFFYSKSTSSATATTADDKPMLYFDEGELFVKGNITATSFTLSNSSDYTKEVYWIINDTSKAYTSAESETNWKNWSTTAPNLLNNKGKYLHTKTITKIGSLSTTTYDVSYIPEDGSEVEINPTTQYAVSNSSTSTPTSWKNNKDDIINNWNETNQYLWTKVTINNGTPFYTISRYSKDGESIAGKDANYVTAIRPLYFLELSTTSTTGATTQQAPVRSQITNKNEANKWTTTIPTYSTASNIKYQAYWRCEEYTWKEKIDDDKYSYSTPYIDYGITTANLTATSASTKAENIITALTTLAPNSFNTSGMLSDYKFKDKYYKLALTSDKNILIGANSGITMVNADENGAAVVIDNSGIAVNAATVHIRALLGDSNDVVSLSSRGITVGSTGSITLNATKNLIINSGNFQITNDGAVTMTGTVTATSGKIAGWNIYNNRLYSRKGSDYTTQVVLDSGTDGWDYAIWVGATVNKTNGELIPAPFSVTRNGSIRATAGTIGGWTLEKDMLYSTVTGYAGTGMSANISTTDNISYTTDIYNNKGTTAEPGFYAFWAGNSDPRYAPFRVTRNGEVFIEKLIVREVTGKDDNDQDIYTIGSYNLSGDISSTNSLGGGGASGWVATLANLEELLRLNFTYGNKGTNTPDDKLILTPTFNGTPIQSKIATFTLSLEDDKVILGSNRITLTPELSLKNKLKFYLTSSNATGGYTLLPSPFEINADGNYTIYVGYSPRQNEYKLIINLKIKVNVNSASTSSYNDGWDAAVVQDGINEDYTRLPSRLSDNSDSNTAIFSVPISKLELDNTETRTIAELTYTLNVPSPGGTANVITVTGSSNDNGNLRIGAILRNSTALSEWYNAGMTANLEGLTPYLQNTEILGGYQQLSTLNTNGTYTIGLGESTKPNEYNILKTIDITVDVDTSSTGSDTIYFKSIENKWVKAGSSNNYASGSDISVSLDPEGANPKIITASSLLDIDWLTINGLPINNNVENYYLHNDGDLFTTPESNDENYKSLMVLWNSNNTTTIKVPTSGGNSLSGGDYKLYLDDSLLVNSETPTELVSNKTYTIAVKEGGTTTISHKIKTPPSSGNGNYDSSKIGITATYIDGDGYEHDYSGNSIDLGSDTTSVSIYPTYDGAYPSGAEHFTVTYTESTSSATYPTRTLLMNYNGSSDDVQLRGPGGSSDYNYGGNNNEIWCRPDGVTTQGWSNSWVKVRGNISLDAISPTNSHNIEITNILKRPDGSISGKTPFGSYTASSLARNYIFFTVNCGTASKDYYITFN